MSKLKRFAGIFLALVLALGMTCSAFADTTPAVKSTQSGVGSITISNATIGATYHAYKLFDSTYGDSYTDAGGNTVTPTAYTATGEQRDALEAESDNVFVFTAIVENVYTVTYYENSSTVEASVTDTEKEKLEASGVTILSSELTTVGTYQVTVGTDPLTGEQYTDEKIIEFVQSYVCQLSTNVFACYFPGATDEVGSNNTGITDSVATASSVEINNLPLGYYFVTSSLGSVVSLSTANPEAEITDKNTSEPDWDNNPDEPVPDDPVKDVLNKAGTRSIDEEKVAVGDVLTYTISYTNNSGETLDDVVVYDAAPTGTDYVSGSINIQFLDSSSNQITAVRGIPANEADIDANTIYYELDGTDASDLTWTIKNLPDGATLVASFQVTITKEALTITDKTVVNDADLTVTLGENTYNLKTNKVKNPVGEEGEPEKDVNETYDDGTYGDSIDGDTVSVGQILTYTITYENEDAEAVTLTVEDAPPTGTVYVKDSAGSTLSGQTAITVDADNHVTWVVTDLAAGATVTVYFQVEVTEAALSITDNTITNSADVTIGENKIKTNTVKNPTDEPDEPEDEDFGKVIVEEDGTETKVSTGSYGDTVKFDLSIDAVNSVANDAGTDNDGNGVADPVQVSAYYIYDQMDPGFTLDADSFVLTINDVTYSVNKDTTQKYSGVTTYTLDGKNGVTGTLFTSVYSNGYTLIAATIPWVDDAGDALYPDCEIHLTYTATINTDAVIAGSGNINRAIYDYSTVDNTKPYEPDPTNPTYPNGDDLNHKTDEITTVTYTYALGIQKISKETGLALEGAQFSAVDAGGNTIYAVPVYDTNNTTVLYYNYTSDPTAKDATSTFVSDADGQILIKGVDIGTYSFTEGKAPSGYVLLTDSVDVTAQMDSASTGTTYNTKTITRYFEAVTSSEWDSYSGDVYTKNSDDKFTLATKPDTYTDGYYKLVSVTTEAASSSDVNYVEYTFDVNVASVLVENAAGIALPGTGGMGTTLFYIIGCILIFGAAVLLITRKRMKKTA